MTNMETDSRATARNIILLAVWFGLVAGLVEGVTFLAGQHFGWLASRVDSLSVAPEILWIAPLFDVVLFFGTGLALALATALARVPLVRPAFFLFSFMTFFDWVDLTGRLRLSGALLLSLGAASVLSRRFRKNEAWIFRSVKRSLPFALALTLLLFGWVEARQWYAEREMLTSLAVAPSASPNIVIIVLDTVRADHVSSYGYRRATTPNLDRIAQQGVLFENAISTSSWTLPAHASLLTGRLPHDHGATHWTYDGHLPNLAEELRHLGYRTGAFSANTLFFSRQRGFGGGFIHFEDVFSNPADMMLRTAYGREYFHHVLRRTGPGDYPGRKTANAVNSSFLRWIDLGGMRPFFVILNYFDAHAPYLPPQPYRNMFSKIPNPGGELNDMMGRFRPRRPEFVQSEMDAYDGAIAYMDAQLGWLSAKLDERGLTPNTLLIILSDHGELFGEHDLYMHRNGLYRPLIHVPMVFRWPERLPAGKRVGPPVSLVSIPSTVLELIGRVEDSRFPAPSLAPLCAAKDPPKDLPYPLSELGWFPYEEMTSDPAFFGPTVSILTPRWELIKNEKLGVSLFDWTQDPLTLSDLANTPAGERIRIALAGCLKVLITPPRAGSCELGVQKD